MMRGVVEYNPAARVKPPRLVREISHTPVFDEAEIVAFLNSIKQSSLKDIRDKAIFCVLLYSSCRVSALINLAVADYYERAGQRWLRFQEKRGGGSIEIAQQIAGHKSPSTTRTYDRSRDLLTIEEVERVQIGQRQLARNGESFL